MSPGKQIDEAAALRERVAALEAEIQRERIKAQTTEGRFRALADHAPVPIWMSGPDTLCTYFNQAWLEYRGRTLEQEMGSGWTDGIHPEDRGPCFESYLRAFTAREPFHAQFRLKRADGSYRWVEASGVARFDDDGRFAGYLGSAADIHERKRGIFTPDSEAMRLVFSLTERERQVLVLIAEGKTTREVGTRLGISYKTADSHRSRILEKLGVHETASMVRYAIRAGLLEP